jgi:hypothetical protein
MRKDPHEKATTEIMRLRRPDHESLSNRSSSLSRTVLIRKEIHSMMEGTDSSSMEVGKRYVETKQSIGSSLRTLLRDVFIASKRLEVCTEALGTATAPQMQAFTLAWEFAANVYNQLMLWPSTLPPAWKRKACHLPVTLAHIDGMVNCEGQVYVFSSLQHGAIYGAYQCSCIHLCQSLRKAYRFIHRQSHGSSFAPSEEGVLETLNSTIDDVLGTSPFMLGDVNSVGEANLSVEKRALGAFFLLRSVYVALSVDTLSQAQLRKFLELLRRIGTEFGIQTASNRRDKWLAQHPGWA